MRIIGLTSALVFNTFFCFSQYVELIPGKTIDRKLSNKETHQYKINLNAGSYISFTAMQKGVDIMVDVYAPSGKKLKTFDSPNGENGPELVSFDAVTKGQYKIKIYTFNDSSKLDSQIVKNNPQNQGDYTIEQLMVLSRSQRQKMLKIEEIKENQFIGWLSTNAHPLKTVKAGSGFDDLEWLKAALKNVKYVGLGEATHGTREFFQMKHRMVEFLVKEMGFNWFAIEASYSGCQNINDYILFGKGDAHKALYSQGFWTWDTEELIDMIEWMRSYNETVAAEKKIRFYGFDIQVNSLGGGIKKLEQYLQKVDKSIDDTILFKQLVRVDDYYLSNDTALMAKGKLSQLLLTMLIRKPHYLLVSSEREYEQAILYGTVIAQFLDFYVTPKSDKRMSERDWRDYYMAGNFFDLVEKNPDAKVVIWAHNAHIDKDDSALVNRAKKPFGSYLKDVYGDQYFPIGFAFNKGSFQAIETGKGSLEEFTVTSAKKGSLDWYLASVKKENYIINYSQKELPVFVREFIDNNLLTRNYGAVANWKTVNESYQPIVLSREFNGIIFIDSTTRAKPNTIEKK